MTNADREPGERYWDVLSAPRAEGKIRKRFLSQAREPPCQVSRCTALRFLRRKIISSPTQRIGQYVRPKHLRGNACDATTTLRYPSDVHRNLLFFGGGGCSRSRVGSRSRQKSMMFLAYPLVERHRLFPARPHAENPASRRFWRPAWKCSESLQRQGPCFTPHFGTVLGATSAFPPQIRVPNNIFSIHRKSREIWAFGGRAGRGKLCQ